FQEFFALSKIAIVGIELALLLTFFAVNRKRLTELFLRCDQIKSDVVVGILAAVVFCGIEYIWDFANGAAPTGPIHFQSLLLLPLVLLIVGWASALYE